MRNPIKEKSHALPQYAIAVPQYEISRSAGLFHAQELQTCSLARSLVKIDGSINTNPLDLAFHTKNAVLFFIVRNTSIELERATSGNCINTSVWNRSRSSASR